MHSLLPRLGLWLSLLAAAVWLIFSLLEIVKLQSSLESNTILIAVAIFGSVCFVLLGLLVRWIIERAYDVHDLARYNSGD